MNNKEAILQRMKGVQAERKAFGYSVLAGESKDTYTKAPAETNNVQNKNSADDGKISFKEKIVNFGKGLIAPIKSIFASPKNMAITAVTVAASAALIAVTGGAAARHAGLVVAVHGIFTRTTSTARSRSRSPSVTRSAARWTTSPAATVTSAT